MLVIFLPSARVAVANPLPVPPTYMPYENIDISIMRDSSGYSATVHGTYTLTNGGFYSLRISFPVPPDAYNISAKVEGDNVSWTLLENRYPTTFENFSVIEWDAEPPLFENFILEVSYEHKLAKIGENYVFLYPLANVYSSVQWGWKPTTANLRATLPVECESTLSVYFDNNPISYNSENDGNTLALAVSVTEPSDSFGRRDFIITFEGELAWYEQPLNLAAIGIIVTALFGIAYLFRS